MIRQQLKDEWIQVQRNKRLRNSPEVQTSNVKPKLSEYWLGTVVATSNEFANLDENDQLQDDEENTEIKEKSIKSSPIFVDGVNKTTHTITQ